MPQGEVMKYMPTAVRSVLLCLVIILLRESPLLAQAIQSTWTSNRQEPANFYRINLKPLVFYSDIPLRDAQEIHKDILALSQRLQRELGISLKVPMVNIYIIQQRDLFEKALLTKVPQLSRHDIRRSGMFILQDGVPSIFAVRNDRLMKTLRHEWVHAQLNTACGEVPIWLDEGLAMHYQEGRAFGRSLNLQNELQPMLRKGWKPNLERLERLNTMPEMTAQDYSEAWSWVEYFLTGLPQGRQILAGYLNELQKGQRPVAISRQIGQQNRDPARGWRGHFQGPQTGPLLQRFLTMFR